MHAISITALMMSWEINSWVASRKTQYKKKKSFIWKWFNLCKGSWDCPEYWSCWQASCIGQLKCVQYPWIRIWKWIKCHNCGKCGLHHKGHGIWGECSLPTLYLYSSAKVYPRSYHVCNKYFDHVTLHSQGLAFIGV